MSDKPPRTRNAPAKAPKVVTAIAAIMKALKDAGGIEKGGYNEKSDFHYRRIEDVYAALVEQLVTHNLVITPNVLSRTSTSRLTTQGYTLYNSVVEVRYDLVSTIDGSERSCIVFGEASDFADKSTNKAMSAAYKYMAFQLFCIPVADEDGDKNTPEKETPQSPYGAGAEQTENEGAPREDQDH